MPWVNEDMCVGCGICVKECPVDAITRNGDAARIIDEKCIRCGHCHDICPQDAVRHDSERIPQLIESNIDWVKGLMTHYKTPEDQQGFLDRMTRHFTKEMKIAEQTLKRLGSMQSEA
jgi:ferredoxin